MWSVVGGLTTVIWSVVGGRRSVVVLVSGRFFHSHWSVVFQIGGRWFPWSVVGYFLGKWSVVGGAWSVVVSLWAVAGRWFCTTPLRNLANCNFQWLTLVLASLRAVSCC